MDKDNLSKIPFFFVIGRPRSGTTLIQSILDAHPNIQIPGESTILFRLYSKYKNTERIDDALLEQLYEDIIKQPKINYWPMDYAKLKADLFELNGAFNFQKLMSVIYLNFQSAFPKKEILAIGDKNPDYSTYAGMFFKIFPDTKIIYITRDYRDHYLSMVKAGLLHNILPWIIIRWKDSVDRVDKLKQRYPKQFCSFRYEDFIQDPKLHLSSLFKFLEVPDDENVLAAYESNPSSSEKYEEKRSKVFHSKIYQPVDPNNSNKWQRELNKDQVILMDRLVGDSAKKAGYERKYIKYPLRIHWKAFSRKLVIRLFMSMKLTKKLFPMRYWLTINQKYPTIDKVYSFFFKE
jgi:hypothetical protein